MPRNGAGVYTLVNNTWFPPVNGVLATSTDWSTFIIDVQNALTQSVSSDGQTPMTGNLQMGNNKITGLANGTANTDAINVQQLAQNINQWVNFAGTPTFITATSFSVAGDQTAIFQVGRRVRTTNSGSVLVYGTILTSVFGAVTTVTVINDSGVIDSGLSAVSYGLITANQTSLPPTLTGFRHFNVYKLIAGVQNVSVDGGAFTTTGATTFVVPGSSNFRNRVWGAGGGSGGTGGNPSASGGGAGGGYAENLSTATPGTSITITVGAGGTAGAGSATTPTNGGNGGASSVGAFASATGGQGGGGALAGVLNASAPGGTGTTVGGGYTATGGSPNVAFAIAGIPFKATGGAAPLGGQAGFSSASGVSSAGVNGLFPGGGASGSLNQANGAVGGDGQVIIEY